MNREENIMISLEPRHAENILNGNKSVELRRRPMNIEPGSTLWLYAKLPVASIVGKARIKNIYMASPMQLWYQFGHDVGISRKEFFNYFKGTKYGIALVLEEAVRLPVCLSLTTLRQITYRFHPPQFFIRLPHDNPILNAVKG